MSGRFSRFFSSLPLHACVVSRDYVELGLGEEGDLLCESGEEQNFPQFLRDLLKEAVHKRYGRETKFTLTTSYFKAFINFLK